MLDSNPSRLGRGCASAMITTSSSGDLREDSKVTCLIDIGKSNKQYVELKNTI
jgi:hypothetical protein